MPTLTIENLADLVAGTLRDLGRMKWTDIGTDLQEFIALPKLLRRDRVMFKSGKGCQFNLMKDYGTNARNVGLFATDDVDFDDHMVQGDVPIRHTTSSYPFDLREPDINSGDANVVFDLIQTRRAAELGGLATLIENDFWGKPDDSTDVTTPFGLKYWMVSNATTGFNGGNPTGFSSGAANIDQGTYSRWANYTTRYVNVTKDDLIKKLRTAHRKTRFISPTSNPSYAQSIAHTFQLYVNEATISDMEDLGEAQNENLGRDLASMDGQMMFRRNPIIYVPKLDAETTNPVYGVNWNVFRIFFLRGWYFKETVKPAANQHTVVETHTDLSWNTICYDRRRLFLADTA